ncbi:hypothetical protein KI387_032449 [Taxus chinensis]|uniref:Peptidase A1 domain-containing protein n=1 Tax=Taxus chinensis TaxID=29808 RepID=A0AA38BRX8_TAXCH|nr:hypothetical protein KI387_032449 [Taxus chinensis]
MARLRLLLTTVAIVCIFFRQLPANAQRAKALVTPITKDVTNQRYTVEIQLKTPLQKQVLTLDLTADYAKVRCSKKSFISSTYTPVDCSDGICKSYEYSGCSICYSPTEPGCHNGTCVVPGVSGLELARDVAAVRSTRGSNPGPYVKAPGVVFACQDDARGPIGVAGMTSSSLALPAQLSLSLGITRKFAMCLPSSSTSRGALFFGSSPYVFLPPPGKDLSTRLVRTPLLKNNVYTDDYYIGLRGIHVDGVDVPFNKSTLHIDSQGRGGTRLETLVPYTQLSPQIYNSLVHVFTNVAKKMKMNLTRADPVDLFNTCFYSKGVGSTRVGPAVPTIDLVLQNNATWRLFGANSMVQVSDKVMCLGFTDVDLDPRTTVVIGSHQIEDNLLEFDLATSTLGLSSSLLFQQTTCSNFNFTSSK